jgi:hypothetical protein
MAAGEVSPAIWGIPVVSGSSERAALFPSPATDQRVFNKTTGNIERYNGSSWVSDFVGGRTYGIYNTKAEGLACDSVTDDRALFNTLVNTTMQPNGGRLDVVGIPRLASDVTVPSNVTLQFLDGAYLAPDGGDTVQINGPVDAQLRKIFGGGGAILIGRGFIKELYPEWWGASNSAAAATNAAACQAAVCTSLGTTSIAAALVVQPTLLYAPVVLNALYPVNASVFLPRYAHLRGAVPNRRYGFSATADNVNILVLGRQLLENDWIDVTLENVDIEGSYSAVGQVGIKASFTGGGGYVSPLTFTNVKVTYLGGIGIDLIGSATSAIIRLYWDRVMVDRTTSYVVHTKIGIFNESIFNNCYFADAGNGFFVEDDGSLTNSVEAMRFCGTIFEANGAQAPATGVGTVSCTAGAATFSSSQAGKIINGAIVTVGASSYTVSAFNGTTGCTLSGTPTFGASAFTWYAYAIGSFGFKSTVFNGQYEFDDCYFESNGNNAADTTGANIWVRQPWMLKVQNTLLTSANNQIWLNHGGQVILEGNYVFLGASSPTSFVTIDDTPTASSPSNVHIGRNHYGTTYTEAQIVRRINGATTATTSVTGFTDSANYVENPARLKRAVLRDGRAKTLDDGAVSYNAVKRILDNSGGANSIAVNGVGTIVKDTYQGLVEVSTDTGGSLGLFLFTANLGGGGGVGLAFQVSTGNYYSITKDTATHMNVYWETTLGAFVIQNKMAGAIKVAVRFIGCDWLQHADDGYYETQFA